MNIPFVVRAAVTNGEQTEIAALDEGRLLLYHNPTGTGIFLGKASQERIDQLVFNLNQLRSVLPEKQEISPVIRPGDPGFTWPACEQCGSTSLRCGCD